MSDKPKIHVFMGAPPPPPPPPLVSVPGGGVEDEGDPLGQWRTMELSWQAGRLRPRTGESDIHRGGERCGDTTTEEPGEVLYSNKHHGRIHHDQEKSTSVKEGASEANTKAGRPIESLPSQSDLSSVHKEDLCTKAGQPIASLPDQDGQLNADEEGLCTEADQFQRLSGQDNQSNADKEDVCSESIHDYLDSCFPAAQPNSDPEYSSDRSNSKPNVEAPVSVSVRTEYLSTWTVSQALLMRGRRCSQLGTSPEKSTPPQTSTKHPHTSPSVSSSTPELYSPVTPTQSPTSPPTQQGSIELFSQPMLSQRLEEGGVILEATPDGLLCSQGEQQREVGSSEPGVSRAFPLPQSPAQAQTSPTMSPTYKRPRMSPTAAKTKTSPPIVKANIMLQGPTTLLVRCVTPRVRYSVLVAVVHPCHLKEIKVKSGALAGNSIPLASLVVTDQSGVEMKVVLWRHAAFWALTVYPGDILLITGVVVNEDKWRGETVLQSTHTCRLLNLGQVTARSSPAVPQNVNGRALRSLCVFLRERRPLLVSLPPRVPQNPNNLSYARLWSLKPDTLVHALLRVTHADTVTAWRAEAEGQSRSGGVLKAVLMVEQGNGQQGVVVLWGAALAWLTRINRNKEAVWDFRVLLVRQSMTPGLPELHSTPWGSCQPLFPDDCRALEFYRTQPGRSTSNSASTSTTNLELDLHTLLSQKYTGNVELRVQITAVQFQGSPSQDAPQQPLDSATPLERILDTVNSDVTYTGCGRCAVELGTDANGIYSPCYPCLPHTAVRRYYRPVVLTVREGESQVCVQVPPVLLQKILLNTPPDKLNKTVAPGSEVKHAQVVAERIQSLLSLPRRTFILTIRSHFQCDENSVPTAQDFLLLDFQFPGE